MASLSPPPPPLPTPQVMGISGGGGIQAEWLISSRTSCFLEPTQAALIRRENVMFQHSGSRFHGTAADEKGLVHSISDGSPGTHPNAIPSSGPPTERRKPCPKSQGEGIVARERGSLLLSHLGASWGSSLGPNVRKLKFVLLAGLRNSLDSHGPVTRSLSLTYLAGL